ncbi:hypothetical protein BG004_005650 [Podila humilis]|nr:hypothetical protein BG004_005650 [Podila humilis]
MPMPMALLKGLGIGRKLSLSNLAKAVHSGTTESVIEHSSCSKTGQPADSDFLSNPSSKLTPTATTPTSSAPILDNTMHSNIGHTLAPPTQTQAPQLSTATAGTSATLLGSPFASSTSLSSILRDVSETQDDDPGPELELDIDQQNNDQRPVSICSIGTLATSSSAPASSISGEISAKKHSKPWSKATNILLNLESSSNDARFQEILHNTIALDHFRQFCFQEYSIENLLFWLDVELFSRPSNEVLNLDNTSEADHENTNVDNQPESKANSAQPDTVGQFAVKHARYIYLTYIDSCAPLQVNLSDETRTEIPWPLLNHQSSSSNAATASDADLEGWPVDRRMFDAAQEHTYQLMKGHTLGRFEESELWRSVEKIICEQPELYAEASIRGPLNTYYRPNVNTIDTTVTRSRCRRTSTTLQALYNWNNSTSDLDRSRDKEEALAMTMSQYFGPIPAYIRQPARIILGLGGANCSDNEDDDYDYDFDHIDGATGMGTRANMDEGDMSGKTGKRTASGLRKARFSKLHVGKKRLSSGSNVSDDSTIDHRFSLEDDLEDSCGNGRRVTRWMVAGYFNDQVRLTAAQRKRLLRRNNKLTKFFGSRVDGTLRPVEEIAGDDAVGSVSVGDGAQQGISNSAQSSGPPLAYALSSSTIHDLSRHSSKASKNAAKLRSKKMFGHSEFDVGNKPVRLLQKFKKSHSAPLDFSPTPRTLHQRTRSGGPLSPTPSNVSQPLESFPGLLRSLPLTPMSQPKEARKRAATVVVENTSASRFVAHPHPLWSGSLSDQEGTAGSGAYERRRGLSILSIMAGGSNTIHSSPKGEGDLDPLLPSPTFIRGGGNSLDRHVMLSRRKKADKLSTFFGATLTKQELASQLTMTDDDNHLVEYGECRASSDSYRSENIGSKPASQDHARHTNPSVATVNQLSHRERSILWRRSKKLREILGESLPEAEVEHALTRPILLLGSSKLTHPHSHSRRVRRRSSARSLRIRRYGSTASLRSHGDMNQGPDVSDYQSGCHSNDSDDFDDDENDDICLTPRSLAPRGRRGSSTSQSHYHGRVHKRRYSVSRPGSFSSTASYSRRGSLRPPTSGDRLSAERSRSSSVVPSNSAMNSRTDAWLLSLEEKDTQEEPEARQSSSSLGGCHVRSANLSEGKRARFNRKKKMDKIHQFLGDRVPEQDLWMGAVGRERTLQMMSMNLITTNDVVSKPGKKSTSSPSQSRPLSSYSNILSPTSVAPLSSACPGYSPLLATMNSEVPKLAVHATATAEPLTAAGENTSGSAPRTSSGSRFFIKHGIQGRGRSKAHVANKGSDPGIISSATHGVRLERSLSDPLMSSRGGVPAFAQASALQQRASDELPSLRAGVCRQTRPTLSTVGQLRMLLASGREASGDPEYVRSVGENIGNEEGTGGLILTADINSTEKTSTSLFVLGGDGEDMDLSSMAVILPRLRAMSEEDQERFLKSAEKLEKMFGSIPPSALLESSLTTTTLRHTQQVQQQQQSLSSEEDSQPRSLVELAGLLANAGVSAGSGQQEKDGVKTSEQQEQQHDELLVEDTIESLEISKEVLVS